MNIFHHHLEPIEAASFRNLDLGHEALSKILQHNAIAGSEKGQNMLDEVLLISGKLFPVLNVFSKIDLINGPEAGHLVLVHLPDVVVLDWQDHEAMWVLLEQWLGQTGLSLRVATLAERIVL